MVVTFEIGMFILRNTFNTLRPRRNYYHFAEDIFNYILLQCMNFAYDFRIVEFLPKVRINNVPALLQIMAWRRASDEPLSEPTLASVFAFLCLHDLMLHLRGGVGSGGRGYTWVIPVQLNTPSEFERKTTTRTCSAFLVQSQTVPN